MLKKDEIENLLTTIEDHSTVNDTIRKDIYSLHSYYDGIGAKKLKQLTAIMKYVLAQKNLEKIGLKDIKDNAFLNPDSEDNAIRFCKFASIVGVNLFNSDNYKKAESWFKAGLKVAKSYDKAKYINKSYINLGHLYYKQKHYEKSAEMFLKIYEKDKTDIAKLKYLKKAIRIYLDDNSIKKASKLLKMLINDAEDKKEIDSTPYIKQHVKLNLQLAKQSMDSSESDTRQALAEAQENLPKLNTEDRMYQTYEIGKIEEKLGDLVNAMDYYFEVFQHTKIDFLPKLHAKVSLRLAMGYMQVDEYDKSESLLNEALKSAKEVYDQKTMDKVTKTLQKIKRIKKEKKSEKVKIDEIKSDTKAKIEAKNSLNLRKTPTRSKEQFNKVEKKIKTVEEPTQTFEDYYDVSNLEPQQQVSSSTENNDELLSLPMEDFEESEAIAEQSEPMVRNENQVSSESGERDQVAIRQSRDFETVRNALAIYLRRHDFQVTFNTSVQGYTGNLDIVAVKGSVRKKKLFILIASNPSELGLNSYLLKTIQERGKKIIFLLQGERELVDGEIQVITSVNELEL